VDELVFPLLVSLLRGNSDDSKMFLVVVEVEEEGISIIGKLARGSEELFLCSGLLLLLFVSFILLCPVEEEDEEFPFLFPFITSVAPILCNTLLNTSLPV